MQRKPLAAVFNVGLQPRLPCHIRYFVAGIGHEQVRLAHSLNIAVVIGHFDPDHVVLGEQFQQFESRKVKIVVLATTHQIHIFPFARHPLSSLIPSSQ